MACLSDANLSRVGLLLCASLEEYLLADDSTRADVTGSDWVYLLDRARRLVDQAYWLHAENVLADARKQATAAATLGCTAAQAVAMDATKATVATTHSPDTGATDTRDGEGAESPTKRPRIDAERVPVPSAPPRVKSGAAAGGAARPTRTADTRTTMMAGEDDDCESLFPRHTSSSVNVDECYVASCIMLNAAGVTASTTRHTDGTDRTTGNSTHGIRVNTKSDGDGECAYSLVMPAKFEMQMRPRVLPAVVPLPRGRAFTRVSTNRVLHRRSHFLDVHDLSSGEALQDGWGLEHEEIPLTCSSALLLWLLHRCIALQNVTARIVLEDMLHTVHRLLWSRSVALWLPPRSSLPEARRRAAEVGGAVAGSDVGKKGNKRKRGSDEHGSAAAVHPLPSLSSLLLVLGRRFGNTRSIPQHFLLGSMRGKYQDEFSHEQFLMSEPSETDIRASFSLYSRVVSSHRQLWCRQCYQYDCRVHGCGLPPPARLDSEPPCHTVWRKGTAVVQSADGRVASCITLPAETTHYGGLRDVNAVVAATPIREKMPLPTTTTGIGILDRNTRISMALMAKSLVVFEHNFSSAADLLGIRDDYAALIAMNGCLKLQNNALVEQGLATVKSACGSGSFAEDAPTNVTGSGNGTSEVKSARAPGASLGWTRQGRRSDLPPATAAPAASVVPLPLSAAASSMPSSCAPPRPSSSSNATSSSSSSSSSSAASSSSKRSSSSPSSSSSTVWFRRRAVRSDSAGASEKVAHAYEPCHHKGPCVDPETCKCLRRGTKCEKFCGCDKGCCNRFPGCTCVGGCMPHTCECALAGRECDPDACRNCLAHNPPANLQAIRARLSRGHGPAIAGRDASGTSTPWNGASSPRGSDAPNDKAKGTVADSALGPCNLCFNMPMQLGLTTPIHMGRSHTHGWGCFATQDMVKNQHIMEYVGELIDSDTANERGSLYDKQGTSYLFDLNEEQVIDAARMGNRSKFLNHSPDPNCLVRTVLVNGDHRISMTARRAISAGEELCFDYGYNASEASTPMWARRTFRQQQAGAGKMSGKPSKQANK